MSKFVKTFKDIFSLLLIVVVIFLVIFAVTKISSIKNGIINIFSLPDTNIYAFDGADKNYNGGLTRKEIEKQKENDNCPTHEDVICQLNILDYGDLVCFYKEEKDVNGNVIYPNIAFIKTKEGLKFDGALNMHGEAYAGWFGIGAYFKIEQQYSRIPTYSKDSCLIFDLPADLVIEQVGFSGFISRAVEMWGQASQRNKLSHDYIIQNIYPYFLKFYNNNIEIIQDENTADGDFNYFYDYIYRCSKSYDYGLDSKGNKITFGTCMVDVSNLTVYPLPESLQGKYEIPNTSPQEYFGIYNCKVFINCKYELKEPQLDFSNDERITKGTEDDPIENRDLEEKTLHTVEFNLIPNGNFQNSKIKEVVNNSPVSIIFKKDDKEYKKIIFTKDLFINAKASLLAGFETGEYIYEIKSNALLFDSFSGKVEILRASLVTIKYNYQDGKVMTKFAISPLSNDIDYTNIDLKLYPVRLILTSEDKKTTHQFIFDDANSINTPQTSLMNLGKYSYTILSEKLVFGSTTGSIEITPENRDFNFSFGIVYNRSDLDFSVTISQTSNSSNGKFSLSGDSNSVGLLGGKLNLQNYYVIISIFDEKGNQVETFNHIHNGSGSCGDSWTTSNLVDGQKYIAQMTYCNDSDSSKVGYIEYQSSTFSFTYKLSTKFTITYSCSEVN